MQRHNGGDRFSNSAMIATPHYAVLGSFPPHRCKTKSSILAILVDIAIMYDIAHTVKPLPVSAITLGSKGESHRAIAPAGFAPSHPRRMEACALDFESFARLKLRLFLSEFPYWGRS